MILQFCADVSLFTVGKFHARNWSTAGCQKQDGAIREDLHSVNRVTSSNGQVTYRAAHTPDGHADRCTALALAVRAASDVPPPMVIQRVRLRSGAGNLGMGKLDGKVWL